MSYTSPFPKTLSAFTVSSTNIRGICAKNKAKSRLKLEVISSLNTDISIIIDSHVDKLGLEKLYKDNRVLLSKYNVISNYAARRGILILFKKTTGITLGNVLDHENKDILIFSIMTSANETIDIAAIYGPSHEDDPAFFQEVHDTLERRGNKNRIIIGDWNATLNRVTDERGYKTNCHKKVRELLTIWQENELMFDIHSFWQPGAESMTWQTKAQDQSSRLDMAWASGSILAKTFINKLFHTHDVTDHASLIVTVDIEAQKNGPGIFRARAGIQYIQKYQSLIKNTIKKILFNNIKKGSNKAIDIQRSLFQHRLDTEEDLEKLKQELDMSGITSESDYLKQYHLELKCALLLSNEPHNEDLMEIKDCIKDPSDLHEEVLKGIQEVTINFSKALKTDTKISTSDLKRKLGELIDTNIDNINTEQIKETEDAINQIEQEWLKTILINDERYALLDDEKPSKAFLNMENSKGGYSNIVLLKRDTIFTNEDGSQYTVTKEITKGEEIRSIIKDDFQKIFKKQPELNVGEADLEAFLVSDEDENTAQHHSPLAELRHRRNITNWQMQKTGGEITSAELRACLFNKMKGNSAPGIDGFTVSWLRVFWEDMEALTTKAINDCYTKGELTETMNTAVIKLLRKGAKDPTYSNSYRPISLLSIHYKLASCAITQRLKPLMKTLIGRQQKAYITNNVIGSCLINLISAIRHVSIKKLSGLILLIDFKKAFDSIDHGFIRTALRAYGFEKSIIRWILLFFDKREAFILLGGHKTENIQLQQGVPQGDVVSPYIFILMVEILLIKINYTSRIKGITFAKHESRSETFADDTSILIERKEEYLRYAMKFIQMFHNISGLCCNLEKTVVIPIGENTNTNDRLCPELNLEWSNKFTLLGFSLDSTLSTLDDNFNKCMTRAKKLIVKWRKYNLSIMGRITVAKSMLLSQFTYVVSVLDITKAQINQIQLLIDTFIMHNSYIGPGPSKKAWIKSAILHGPKHLGGLGGVKVEEFIHGLNISWIHRYSTKNYNDHWCDLLDNKYEVLIDA